MQNLDKGVVFTTDETMQVKAFGQPLYKDQPVYRAVTEELLQEHLHCYCQPESPKTAVQKSHSKGPEL